MQIGKYTLGREIGRGGMGTVYESFHPQLSRPVAIKLIQSSDAESRQIFMREAQTVAGLSHPHIINIFDVDEYQGQPFLVMELFEASLADRIARRPLTAAETIQIGLKLTDALGYAHDQAIIHRDIKPANVLLRQDDTPVLADFGLARALASASTQTAGMLVGTPAYMAPEQFQHQPATVRSDLYALGVLLFEALTGRVPFDGDTAEIIHGHLQQPVPAMQNLAANIPPALETLILSLLEKEPMRRPAHARAVAQSLAKIQRTLQPSTRNPTKAGTAPATGPTIALRQLPDAMQLPDKSAQPNKPQQAPLTPPVVQGPKPFVIALIGISIVILIAVMTSLFGSPKSSQGKISVQVPTIAFVAGVARPTSQLTQLPLHELRQARMVNPQQPVNTSEFSYSGITWEDTANSITFYGELRNESQTTQAKVNVQITLRNANGQALSSTKAAVQRAYLKPGEVAPFYVLFFKEEVPQVKFTDYTVEVLSKPVETFELNYYLRDGMRTEVSEVGQGSIGDIPVVRGTYYNDLDTPIGFPEVVAVFYNEAGEIIGLTSCYAHTPDGTNTMAAKSSAPFETIFFTPTQRGATAFLLYVDARQVTK